MKRLDIEKYGLEFKNLLSGPAPVGRILNYVYIAGTTGMYHKNGYRSLDFKEQIGSAWATEFIIGLGIFSLGAQLGDKYQLVLTKKGQMLFDVMSKGNYVQFDEGSTANAIENVKNESKKTTTTVIDLLREEIKWNHVTLKAEREEKEINNRKKAIAQAGDSLLRF